MKLDEYETGDEVEVSIRNPKTDEHEWREGVVIAVRTMYPSQGTNHKPYPMAIIKTTRTYCKATPKYRHLQDKIRVFVDNSLEFYDKESTEGFVYNNEVRQKIKCNL